MPVTRIAIREGKTSEYKRALMDEIYEAMRETVNIATGGSSSGSGRIQACAQRMC